ncbi:ABC transporter permease [Sphingomonas sp. XXL09]|uniref:ABC transporter permease n=1 Tax=Sphingomonas sp. XXL09 TaxID=3457787 RepID=UPI00406BDB10
MTASASALLSFYRSLIRHRLFALLNVGGLALGIAVFLVLFLYVRFETGYDRVLPGWERLYVVNEEYDRPGAPAEPNSYTMGGELDLLRGDFPDVIGTRVQPSGTTIRQGNAVSNETMTIVDPGFFRLFPFETVEGDADRTLRDPDGLVVTQTAAHKYFGEQSALGHTLTLAIGKKDHVYRVGAVLRDPPRNVSFTSPLYVPMVRARFADQFFDHWGSTSLHTIVRFADPAAAQAFDQRLKGFVERHAYPSGNIPRGQYRQFVTPLADLHLSDPGDRTIVRTLGGVGVLTLIIAIINYINLATARSGLRAREVAVRKVLGGTRTMLIAQFIGEAIATVALAALIGLALAELALPLVNMVGGTTLTIRYWGRDGILPPLAMLVVTVGVLAGLYPALSLSGYRPAAVLASARTPGGGRSGSRLRAILVIVQFATAIVFGIATAVMLAQTDHLAKTDLGFRRDGMIVVKSTADDGLSLGQRREVLTALRNSPGVVSAALGLNAPGRQSTTNTTTAVPTDDPQRKVQISIVDTGEGYFHTAGAHLLAGRLFDPRRGEDDSNWRYEPKASVAGHVTNVVVNATAAQKLGYATPAAAIGKMIDGLGSARIIGVIADMRFESPREPMRPTLYLWGDNADWPMMTIVRYRGVDAQAVIAALEARWKQIVPAVPFDAVTAQTSLYDSWYKQDAQRANLFTIGAVLAVLIGCIGLYGLAAFDTARRIKEIGIRKTLGASTADVLRLLIGQFMRPVVLANIIAWPIAFLAMRRWLSGFDDRIALSPLFFIGVALVAVVIATATIFAQAWRVARAEPARALRYE